MPSPLAHTVTGAALAYLHPAAPRNPFASRWIWPTLGVLALSILPDLDFFLQIAASRRIHHTFTHSLVFTLAICALIALLIRWMGWGSVGTSFSISLLAYGSHILLDMLGGGPGVTFWWPFSHDAVRFPVQIFPDVNYSQGLIDASHLTFLAFESFYAIIVTALVTLAKRLNTAGRRRRPGSHATRSAGMPSTDAIRNSSTLEWRGMPPKVTAAQSSLGSTDTVPPEPWQLKVFRKTLKKRKKLQVIAQMLGERDGLECLLITHGDNNGALNWHFKQLGGTWSWADFEGESVRQIAEVTGDRVSHLESAGAAMPFPSEAYDVVLTIDVHEHINQPAQINRELARIAKPGGRVVISTPNGDPQMLAVRIKHMIGMTPDVYGHRVIGFRIEELEQQLRQAGLQPLDGAHYAKFFTEMLELVINFAYVKVLAGRGRAPVQPGQIAPQSEDQLRSAWKSYRLYSLVYPVFWLVSKLDNFVPSRRGYAVVVAGRKPVA